ncbi:MAG: FHA domain-containing protein [Chloroflexi bacterium]|nr:FHA domain-containing protein [Chloroflexota bacterium]
MTSETIDIDLILFFLRLISGAILLGILAVAFVTLWRDYRSAVEKTSVQRRVYGQMIEVEEIEDGYQDTNVSYPLLPLTSIGRGLTNSIPISDDFASSEHALLALRDGQWWLEDRNSRNGTTINGLPIVDPIIVTDGDIVGVGSRRFRIHLE